MRCGVALSLMQTEHTHKSPSTPLASSLMAGVSLAMLYYHNAYEGAASVGGIWCKCLSCFRVQAAKDGRQWDYVVLDPPKLAPNRKSLSRAASKCALVL